MNMKVEMIFYFLLYRLCDFRTDYFNGKFFTNFKVLNDFISAKIGKTLNFNIHIFIDSNVY